MPSRRAGGGAARGAKGTIATAVMILLIIAAIIGWWNVNGFKSIGDAIDWLRDKSDRVGLCVDENLSQGPDNIKNLINAHSCIFPDFSGGGDTGPSTPLPTDPGTPAETPTKEAINSLLESIPVAPSKDVDYVRSQWKHWSDLDGNGCDSREDALVRGGTNVTTDPKTCKVLSGNWVEQYSNESYTDPSKMDLDHVVALSWAASNGGNDWDSATKEAFANDPTNLILASASENRSKGDKGPSKYMPKNESFHCIYITAYIEVLAKYELTIPQADKDSAAITIRTKC